MIKFSNLQLFGAVLLLAQPVFAAQAIEEEVDPNGPWMVCEVAVEGLRNISKRTVTKAGSAKKGALYERYSVSEDINDISALGNFDKVEVDISRIKGTKKDKQFFQPYPCHRLTYIVTEKPIFDRLTYQGRKHLGKGAITQAMTLKLKDPFNQAKLDADLARIQAKYAEKGYVNAQIKYELTRVEKENTVEVKLIIDEGPRTRVEAVNITGLHEIPLKKLLAKASNKPGKVYKPQNLQRDYVKMMLYGRNQGYAQFMMTEPKLDYNADKSLVSVSYDVTEGPKVDFGTTAFEGSTVFSDAELKEKVYYRTGKLYNQKDF